MKKILPFSALCASLWLAVACGSDEAADASSSSSGAATSSGTAPGGSSGMGASSGSVLDGSAGDGSTPPPAATCTSPETAPDTSSPTTVVTPCTEAALAAAVATGGVITFACGTPTVIPITTTLSLRTDIDTVIDGGGQVTLDGGGTTRILSFDHADYRVNDTRLTLLRLGLAHGKIAGTTAYASAPAPCSQGFYDGYGGALYMRDGVLLVIDSTFDGNAAETTGPDVGGGAISIQGVKKATIIGSTFKNGQGANGGAIESLNSELDVYNSVFDHNVATGTGANSDDSSKCSVQATNGQHQVGSGGNGGAIAIDGGSDGTHTFCGNSFTNNQAGAGALAGAIGRTPDAAMQKTVIDRCEFDANTVPAGGGGALYFHNSELEITASTFHANTAQGCGAVQSDGSVLTWMNDTFDGNEATGEGAIGGAACLFGVTGSLRNVTFANGKASGFGAAIFGSPTLTVDNSIFWNNTADNPGAPMQCQMTATGAGNLQFPANHTNGGAADTDCVTGIAFADAALGAIGAHGGPTQTLVPTAGSPALGIGQTCPATDQRGTARPSAACTAGAVEGSQ